MVTIIGFLIIWLIGGCALWLVGKFSTDSPPFLHAAIGAFIIEFPTYIVSALQLPDIIIQGLPFLITWIILAKIAGMSPRNAFFGAFLYGAIRLLIVFLLLIPLFSSSL